VTAIEPDLTATRRTASLALEDARFRHTGRAATAAIMRTRSHGRAL
jgi:hypothetical protein